MAYQGNQRSSNTNSNTQSGRAPVSKGAARAEPLLKTGLFKPDEPGKKYIASVTIPNDVVLKAGSRAYLYLSNSKKEGGPTHSIEVFESTPRPATQD